MGRRHPHVGGRPRPRRPRELWPVESRFDLDDAATLEAGPQGGLLRDIGSHVVDQALWLLGPAESVYAELEWVDLPEGRTDCGFSVAITHVGGVHSRVSSTKLNRIDERELRAYGSAGGYVSRGTDVQAQAIFSGLRPIDLGAAWGYEDEARWATLHTAAGSAPVPSEQGAYQAYYTQFAAALRGAAAFPVPAAEAVHTLKVLDAARASALERRVVLLPGADGSATTPPAGP